MLSFSLIFVILLFSPDSINIDISFVFFFHRINIISYIDRLFSVLYECNAYAYNSWNGFQKEIKHTEASTRSIKMWKWNREERKRQENTCTQTQNNKQMEGIKKISFHHNLTSKREKKKKTIRAFNSMVK